MNYHIVNKKKKKKAYDSLFALQNLCGNGLGSNNRMHHSLPLKINTDDNLHCNTLPPSLQIKGFQDAPFLKTEVLIPCIMSKGNRWLRHTFLTAIPACLSYSESMLVAKSCRNKWDRERMPGSLDTLRILFSLEINNVSLPWRLVRKPSLSIY